MIPRRNATPVYGFRTLIHAQLPEGPTLAGKRTLDYGMGGPVLPLALFCQHAFDCWGIDVAKELPCPQIVLLSHWE